MDLELLADQQAASKNLGYEALCLLRNLAAEDFNLSAKWNERVRQLLEVWKINSDSEIMRLKEGVEARKTTLRQPTVCRKGDQVEEFFELAELVQWAPVIEAVADDGDEFFRRMVIKSGILYAERCKRTDQGMSDPRLQPICEIENRAHFRIPTLADTKAGTTDRE